jgi:hypothetical protein
VAKEVKSAVGGGNVLMLVGAEAEEVSQLIVGSAEPGRGAWTLESTHPPVAAAFDATMVVPQSVI